MTSYDFSKGPLSPSELDALIEHAHEERAKAMRQMLSRLPALFKRLAARLRPTHQRLPQTGTWAWHH